MKPTVYIETTIPSYLTARPSKFVSGAAQQQATHIWWQTCRGDYELYTSQDVLQKAARGDMIYAGKRLKVLGSIPLLQTTETVLSLARQLLDARIIPTKAAPDAAHLAYCAAHHIEFLLTWNCKHLANARIYRRIEQICVRFGLARPIICTPYHLIGEYLDELEDEGT